MKTIIFTLALLAAPGLAVASPSPDEAFRQVKARYDGLAACTKDTRQNYFITMFEWQLLAEKSSTAREAMINERDEQTRRLLDGDAVFCGDGVMPLSRFQVVIEMNRSLQDSRATYRLTTQLLDNNPALVRREMFMALPAIVEAGDYALALQHIKDPLPRLRELNQLAKEHPLYPAGRQAPRLAAELSLFMADVILLSKSLTGLGKERAANELRAAALKGIASDELRGLASRELAEPGSIPKALAEHQMRLDAEAAR